MRVTITGFVLALVVDPEMAQVMIRITTETMV
jgi:hypothetical protein